MQRYCGHNAFEHNGAPGKGDGIAGFDPMRGLHTPAIELDFAAADRIGRGRTGLEQADCKQPAIDPRNSSLAILPQWDLRRAYMH